MDFLRADKKAIEQNIIALEQKNQRLDEWLEKQRVEYGEKIKPLLTTLGLKDLLGTIQLQSDALNLRQEVCEDIARFMVKYSAQKMAVRKATADRMEFYMTGFGVKTSVAERVQMIDRDLRENQRGLELIETHMEYLRDLRSTCDNIGYAMKNRVSMLGYI
jgi:hypothetical protein